MNATTHAARRQDLRDAVPNGAILIMGNNPAPINYVDNAYPFRQDSHFLYYAGGVSHPGLALLIEPGGATVLYGKPEHRDDVIWSGPHPTLDDYAADCDVDRAEDIGALPADLRGLADAGHTVHYLPPYRSERRFSLARALGLDPREVAAQTSMELVRAVAAQRSIKEGAEIREHEEALRITARMYAATMSAAAPGKTEAQIAAVHQAEALAEDRRQAFRPIVTVAGEVLHNESYGNTLADGDLLLVDSGSESKRCYASDITRTLPVSGHYTGQQREIYEVVLDAQLQAIAAASPDKTNKDLHLIASRAIASGLKSVGLMKGDVDEAVAAGAHALFFVHGLGHMMGLDVHDMEDLGDVVGYERGEERSSQFGLAYLRLARKLEPGFVLTIEPGIYFIPALIDRWCNDDLHADFIDYGRLDAYRDFGGIRIEDDIVITTDGCRVLGPGIPKTVAEVEQAMAG